MLTQMSSPLIVCLGQFWVHVHASGSGRRRFSPAGSWVDRSKTERHALKLLSRPVGLSGKMRVLGVNCFIGSQPVWSVSPRTEPWILNFKWNRNITRLLWLINLIWKKRNNWKTKTHHKTFPHLLVPLVHVCHKINYCNTLFPQFSSQILRCKRSCKAQRRIFFLV